MKALSIGLSFPFIKKQRKVVFHGLSFELPTKGLVVITGDSGVGKTSLLSMISGRAKPTKGRIIYPRSWITSPPIYLEDQLALVSSWHIKEFIHQPETNDDLHELGLPFEARKKRFKELSGGQKIRVMVALFFSQHSACYLLDEPTHALDEQLRIKMIGFLTRRATHALIVVATHDHDLIAAANHELHMQSAYVSKWKDKQVNVGTTIKVVRKNDKVLQKHWLRKLFWLHQDQWLGFMLTVASMFIHVGLLFSGFIHHSFTEQSQRYLELNRLEPFLTIQEVQQTDIYQSPFQLIKSNAPETEQLSMAISLIPDARVIPTIAEWFPTSMTIQHVTFNLRFIDIPYQDDKISIIWIYPKINLPTYFELSSLQLTTTMPPFSYGRDLMILDKRPIQSWFEPPQILLSYWQWFHLLQSTFSMVNGEETRLLNIYQSIHPPSSVLVYDPRGTVKDILMTNPDHHVWTFSLAIDKTYELKHLLMDSTKTLTEFILVGLLILGLFVWSTSLHWIYQHHHRQWRWLLLLHIPKRRLWNAISLKTFMLGFLTLGFVQWLWIVLIDRWHFIPGTTLMAMVWIGLLVYMIQQISRYMILLWYGHA
jgi:ABC-type lipoprotein export system ATPase subunit